MKIFVLVESLLENNNIKKKLKIRKIGRKVSIYLEGRFQEFVFRPYFYFDLYDLLFVAHNSEKLSILYIKDRYIEFESF